MFVYNTNDAKFLLCQFSSRSSTAIGNDPTDLPYKKLTSQFDIGSKQLIQSGGYGTVFRIARKSTGELYALKEVLKQHLDNPHLARNINRERIALKRFDSPFIIKLHNTYQSPDTVYFLMDLASQGDLFDLVEAKSKPLKVACIRFIGAEILLALEYLRTQNFIHRDLKLENILVDCNNHCKVSDFGNAKLIGQPQGSSLIAAAMKNSALGTPAFVAPEVLFKSNVTFGTDYWSLGFMLYLMYTRRDITKLRSVTDDVEIHRFYDHIDHKRWTYPFNHPDRELHDLIVSVTSIVPEERLGTNDIQELKEHPFFRHVDLDVLHHSVAPGFIETDEDNHGHCAATDVPPMNLQQPPQAQPAALPPDSQHTPTTRRQRPPSPSSQPPPRPRRPAPIAPSSPHQQRPSYPSPSLQAQQRPSSPSTPGSHLQQPHSPSYYTSTPLGAPSMYGAVGGPQAPSPSTPSSQMTSPSYLSTPGSMPLGTQSFGDQWRYQTPPPRDVPLPLASAPPADPRRNPLSMLGPAAPTPPSMYHTYGRSSIFSTPSSQGFSPQLMSPVIAELNDLYIRAGSPQPGETRRVTDAEGDEHLVTGL